MQYGVCVWHPIVRIAEYRIYHVENIEHHNEIKRRNFHYFSGWLADIFKKVVDLIVFCLPYLIRLYFIVKIKSYRRLWKKKKNYEWSIYSYCYSNIHAFQCIPDATHVMRWDYFFVSWFYHTHWFARCQSMFKHIFHCIRDTSVPCWTKYLQ